MNKLNLNEVTQRHTDFSNVEPEDVNQPDYSSMVHENMYVETIFKNLENRVIEKIKCADAVVGCVAWLTNRNILKALANVKDGVSVIVQKEDFLRPDKTSGDKQKAELRSLYSVLRPVPLSSECDFERKSDSPHYGGGRVDVSIRCVGHSKGAAEFATPRMHHKFLVFCNSVESLDSYWALEPYAVWSGSFNMTYNGTRSIENALYIKNSKVSESYFYEWLNMLQISESLNWSSTYSEPDIQTNSLFVISER
jgi:hypothetical protein